MRFPRSAYPHQSVHAHQHEPGTLLLPSAAVLPVLQKMLLPQRDAVSASIDYGCLRRAERDFERRVARCLGISPFAADEDNVSESSRYGRYRSAYEDAEDKQ